MVTRTELTKRVEALEKDVAELKERVKALGELSIEPVSEEVAKKPRRP